MVGEADEAEVHREARAPLVLVESPVDLGAREDEVLAAPAREAERARLGQGRVQGRVALAEPGFAVLPADPEVEPPPRPRVVVEELGVVRDGPREELGVEDERLVGREVVERDPPRDERRRVSVPGVPVDVVDGARGGVLVAARQDRPEARRVERELVGVEPLGAHDVAQEILDVRGEEQPAPYRPDASEDVVVRERRGARARVVRLERLDEEGLGACDEEPRRLARSEEVDRAPVERVEEVSRAFARDHARLARTMQRGLSTASSSPWMLPRSVTSSKPARANMARSSCG